jgi:hypothetical protein
MNDDCVCGNIGEIQQKSVPLADLRATATPTWTSPFNDKMNSNPSLLLLEDRKMNVGQQIQLSKVMK